MTSVFERLLNMSVTGSIVIAVVLIVRLCLKRAPKIYSYLLWSVVLFRLLCPVSFSGKVSVLESVPGSRVDPVGTVSYQPVQRAVQSVAQPRVEAAPMSPERTQAAQPKETTSPMAIAAWVWCLGAAGLGLYSLAQYALLRRKLAEAARLEGNVYLSDRVPSPFVMGLTHPKIYLPSETPEGERTFILAHERHHIRRGDPMWKLLAYLALCLHWFNPFVWLAFCLAGKDMEMSCDEAVLKGLEEKTRADYAQALLRLATHKRILSGMPLAFGEGDTKGRIRNMARWRQPKVWVSALCGAVLLVIVAVCALNPKRGQPLEELTRMSGPAGIGVGDFYFTLPEGYTIEAREIEQTKTGDGTMQVITDGTNVLGGVLHFAQGGIQENITAMYQVLGVTEETLGYMSSGSAGKEVTISIFSDVLDGQERLVNHRHNLYYWGDQIYDLWFDERAMPQDTMESLLNSVSLGGWLTQEDSSEEELAYRKCETVMNSIQEVLDSGIQIRTVRHSGRTPDEDYTEDFYYDSEGDFLRLTTTAQGETRGELYSEDRYFIYQGSTWTATETPEKMVAPWIWKFSFDYVTYDAAIDLQEGTGYMFRVNAPFDDASDAAPNYFACFDFDQDDNFTDVFLQINPVRDNSYTLTESVISTDAQVVSARIQEAYAEAAK